MENIMMIAYLNKYKSIKNMLDKFNNNTAKV